MQSFLQRTIAKRAVRHLRISFPVGEASLREWFALDQVTKLDRWCVLSEASRSEFTHEAIQPKGLKFLALRGIAWDTMIGILEGSKCIRTLILIDCVAPVDLLLSATRTLPPAVTLGSLRHLELSGELPHDGATLIHHTSRQLLSLTMRPSNAYGARFPTSWLDGVKFPHLDHFEAQWLPIRFVARKLRGCMPKLRFLKLTKPQWPHVPPSHFARALPLQLQELHMDCMPDTDYSDIVGQVLLEDPNILPDLEFCKLSVNALRVRKELHTLMAMLTGHTLSPIPHCPADWTVMTRFIMLGRPEFGIC